VIFSILYAFTLSILLFISVIINKYRKNKIGILLVLLYFVVALSSISVINNNLIDSSNLKFAPYFILIFSNLLVLIPFVQYRNFNSNNIVDKNDFVYRIICYIYIFASVVMLFVVSPQAFNLIRSGEWLANITESYQSGGNIISSNLLEWISLNLTGYLSTLVLIISFYFAKNGKYKKIALLVFLLVILATFFSAILISSRGKVFNLAIQLIALSFFFFNDKSKRIPLRFKILLVLVISVFVFYAIDVTVDRFSGPNSFYDNPINSLVIYFGQSPIVFNKGVFNITRYSFGYYSFGNLLGVLGYNSNFNQLNVGGSWGSGFYTYVGALYIDFGFIGVTVVSILISIILKKTDKKLFTLSNVYLVFIIFNYLTNGVFVIGRDYVFTLLFELAMYVMLRFLDKTNFAKSIPRIEKKR